MQTGIIILAGGDGQRFGMTKQFIPINGVPLFIYTIQKFKTLKYVPKELDCILVIPEKFKKIVENTLKHYKYTVTLIIGGDTRQQSVKNALNCVHLKYENLLITDANRPCIKPHTIYKCIEQLKTNPMVATVCKSINTSCISTNSKTIDEVLNREFMYELLMPQGFNSKILYEAHRQTNLINCTDDTQIVKSVFSDLKTKIIQMSYWEGIKLTSPEDYQIFEILLGEE